MTLVFLIVSGLILGSFVNALVWRMHEQAAIRERLSSKPSKTARAKLRELSIVHGRSMCPYCKHELTPKDLVPVFSWLWLRGRCRYCHRPIEDTPLPEIGLAVLFPLSYFFWPLALQGSGLFRFVLWLVFLTGFMALAIYDLRWLLLPDRIVYPLAGLAVVQIVGQCFGWGGWQAGLGAIAGVLIIAGVFYVLFQASDGAWIGGGDVKLGVVLGLLAGGPVRSMLVLLFASCSGLLFALPPVLAGRAGAKSQIPFGPFLILGLIVDVLFGGSLVSWYVRLLG